MTGLSQTERTAFVNAYTRTLINTWSDPSYADRLQDDPATVLTEAGITFRPGTTISVQRVTGSPDIAAAAEPSGSSGVDEQLDLYEKSWHTAAFTLFLPDAPTVDRAELATSELSGVAAGGIWDPYCCSCCPSCCSASGGG